MSRSLRICSAVAAAVMVIAGAAHAQTIAQRVTRVGDGSVRMSFASRPDVCGNGRGNINTNGNHNIYRGRDEWEDECEHGPVRIAMDIGAGQVRTVRTYVGGKWKGAGDATDLGLVGTKDAVDYLLGVVARGTGKGAQDAIFPATIADSVTVWPQLIRIAKDDANEKGVRTQAIFWVGQAAGEKATEGLKEVVGDRAADEDVRLQAVFALSQRPNGEGVTALLNVAESSKDPKIRKQAIFWLGQSRDPRAIGYFEKILVGK